MEVWGLTTTERLRRAAQLAGVAEGRIGVGPADAAGAESGSVVLLRSDYVFDDRLVQAMVAARNTLLQPSEGIAGSAEWAAAHVDAGLVPQTLALLEGRRDTDAEEAGLRVVGPADLVGAYAPNLRRTDPPFLMPARPERVTLIERRIFDGAYKGVTDLVTKWVWPTPARWVTRQLARRGIKPNVVTAASWILAIFTGMLFLQGSFAWGLFVGWIMTFLDTVDGKLARVTLTSSRLGDVLDHGLDLLHPPLWYLAWAAGLSSVASWHGPAAAVAVWGYVIGRLIEGLFLWTHKIEIHMWRRIDSRFRTVTARRNPNMILLTASVLAGRPDLGLAAIATWTAISIAFHAIRVGQAQAERWRGRPVESWLNEAGVCASVKRA